MIKALFCRTAATEFHDKCFLFFSLLFFASAALWNLILYSVFISLFRRRLLPPCTLWRMNECCCDCEKTETLRRSSSLSFFFSFPFFLRYLYFFFRFLFSSLLTDQESAQQNSTERRKNIHFLFSSFPPFYISSTIIRARQLFQESLSSIHRLAAMLVVCAIRSLHFHMSRLSFNTISFLPFLVQVKRSHR